MTRRTMAAVPAFVAVAVAVTFLARLILNERAQPAWAQEDPRDVPAARALAIELSDRASDRTVAILWTTGVGRHTLTVYLAQAGQRPVVDFASALVGHPDYIDLDQPLRPGDQPEELLERLDRAIRRHADFVLVCRDTSMYQDVQGTQLWPYLIGRPVVERLLADQAFVSVYDFTFQGRPFSLLENRSARRVPTPGSDG